MRDPGKKKNIQIPFKENVEAELEVALKQFISFRIEAATRCGSGFDVSAPNLIFNTGGLSECHIFFLLPFTCITI
jgi:hypothetical protein